MTCFDATYFEDHLYLLELSTFLEPKTQYSFDYTFQSIDAEIANFELWDEFNDGPIPMAYQEDELLNLCDYYFTDDETIYTGDWLDLY